MNKVSNPIEQPLIIDTSQHNGQLTANQLLSTKCVLVIIRTGISWGYKDPLFDYYRSLCNSIHLPWCGYHVLYPSQPAKPQAENVIRIIGDDPGYCKVPVWNDLELDQGQSPARIAECSLYFGEILQDAFGGEKGIYSRTLWIDWYIRGQTWLNSYWWWLAQYLNSGKEHPGPYTLPKGLNPSRVLLQQTSHKGQIEGHRGDVDFNRWLAGEEVLHWFTGEQEPPEISLTLEERVAALEVEVFGEVRG